MDRTSWTSKQKGQIKLGDEKQPDGPSRIIPVKKEHLEEGILQLLASAADMQYVFSDSRYPLLNQ